MSREFSPDAWVRVSRSALQHNVAALRAFLPNTTQIIAVVKANAYGHGAAQAACAFQDDSVNFFAVTTPDEALELRMASIHGQILMFLPPLPDQLEWLIKHNIILTVCDDASVHEIDRVAVSLGMSAAVHLKIDTGMGRLGALPTEALSVAQKIAASKSIRLEGVYTHFAQALNQNTKFTEQQFTRFEAVLQSLVRAGISPGLRHCANSAAILQNPKFWLDAVRPGTILYGQYPANWLPKKLALSDKTWSLEARIVSVRSVPVGTSVGYGGEFVTKRPTRLAVLPIGSADGFTVAPASLTSGWRGVKALARGLVQRGPDLSVKVRGKSAPIVGRVAMQTCMIDVTDLPDVVPGDVVTIPARRITTSARLPRLYED